MNKKNILEHPCFSHDAHSIFGRIHLPVAPKCNIKCKYCDRKYDCANESRPGITSTVLLPDEAVKRLDEALASNPMLRVAGIAGPGEPLYNKETFETLRLIHMKYPDLVLCVSSNGLLVEEKLEELISCGVENLTITINAIDSEVAYQIYDDVFEGKSLYPPKNVRTENFLEKQQAGLYEACRSGLAVKINTVLIPGVNDGQIEKIARMGEAAGATIMNIMPLIPCGEMIHMNHPGGEVMQKARNTAARFIPQFLLCRQCRADACGIPGLEKR